MHWFPVFLICVITNAILGPIIYILLDKFIHLIIEIKPVGKIYHKIVERTQKKIHPYVEKYGELGLAVFIGLPVPGSGSYSGALGAYLLGLDFKKFTIANFIGVTIAGILVTLIILTGNGAFKIMAGL